MAENKIEIKFKVSEEFKAIARSLGFDPEFFQEYFLGTQKTWIDDMIEKIEKG